MPALQEFHDSTLYLIRAETAVSVFREIGINFFLVFLFLYKFSFYCYIITQLCPMQTQKLFVSLIRVKPLNQLSRTA